MSRQAALATVLLRSGLIAPLLARAEGRLSILAYHRILDDDADPRGTADPGLFSATAGDFDRQMAFVARHFNITTFADLSRGASAPARPLIITFDDGFEDNYRLAYPILRKHGLSAVFFVATDFVDQQKPLWFERVARQLTSAGRPERPGPGDVLLGNREMTPQERVRHALSSLKVMPGDTRRRTVEGLDSLSGDVTTVGPARPMTWEQLREMSDHGMEIGSHSCSHTVLATESRETVFRELGQSKQIIEDRLGRPCVSLAYPVGGRSAIGDEVINVASECGYQYACNYLNGTNSLPLCEQLNLSRQHVETDIPFPLFAAQLALPRIFGYGRS